ncbi:LacI family DNA-binding transcriptional regulator [Kribbella amoyensis]|uniref:LacI family DNA-binding transcriptional regulator n=1 Tax=Kribbella amoyensis TaxID=996641 RepID=UPI001EE2FE4F|nr:LacI family DNA-binding transcriptional regulator [Kribbella amoyensis]
MTQQRGSGGRPTINQVAEAAGVSKSTVSRAFSRPEMITAETVAHVMEVATRLGYVPNHTARALSTGRAGTVAIVVPDIANPFFPPLIRGAQAAADQAGFSLLLGDSDEDPTREDVLVGKLGPQTDGIVLASSRMTEEQILAHAERRPLVLINRDVPGLPRVLIDTATGIEAAVEHLAGLGHRHLVYVSGPASSWSNAQRRHAVRAAGRRLGVKVTAVAARRSTYDAGVQRTEAILASGASAAIAFDDLLAQGVLAGLAERGMRVPDEFSVIGCDDVLAATMYPPLTTVSAHGGDAGRAAVDLLLSSLDGARADVRRELDTSLVLRSTTAPPAG